MERLNEKEFKAGSKCYVEFGFEKEIEESTQFLVLYEEEDYIVEFTGFGKEFDKVSIDDRMNGADAEWVKRAYFKVIGKA